MRAWSAVEERGHTCAFTITDTVLAAPPHSYAQGSTSRSPCPLGSAHPASNKQNNYIEAQPRPSPEPPTTPSNTTLITAAAV